MCNNYRVPKNYNLYTVAYIFIPQCVGVSLIYVYCNHRHHQYAVILLPDFRCVLVLRSQDLPFSLLSWTSLSELELRFIGRLASGISFVNCCLDHNTKKMFVQFLLPQNVCAIPTSINLATKSLSQIKYGSFWDDWTHLSGVSGCAAGCRDRVYFTILEIGVDAAWGSWPVSDGFVHCAAGAQLNH